MQSKQHRRWLRGVSIFWASVLLWGGVWGCDDEGGGGGEGTDTSGATENPDTSGVTENPDTSGATTEPDGEVTVEDAGDAGDTDTGPPPVLTGNWQEIAFTEPGAGVEPGGASDVEAVLGAGQARAGQVTRAGLFWGGDGWDGRCRPGDFKLYNARAAFCIEGPVASSYFSLGGGNIIDAVALNAAGEQIADDALTLVMPELGLRASNFNRVEVIRDGLDGGPAVIRATGQDDQVPLLLGLTGSRAVAPPGGGFELITEYRLRPDTAVVEIVTWISHPGDSTYNRASGDLLFFGDTARYFFEGVGLIEGDRLVPGTSAYYEAIAPGASYGFYVQEPGDVLFVGLGDTNLGPGVKGAHGIIPPGLQGAFMRHFAVGDGSTFSAREAFEQHMGLDVERVAATVRVHEQGDPTLGVPGLMFEVLSADDPTYALGVAQTDADGIARFNIAPGNYTLRLDPWDGTPQPSTPLPLQTAPLTVAADQPADISVEVAPAARFSVSVDATDAGGQPLGAIAAKVWVRNADAERLIQTPTGDGQTILPPGHYQVEVTRGFEYTAITAEVHLVAGDNPVFTATLQHVLPTPGRVGGEFHQHAAPSLDSTVNVRDRTLSNLCDGVDFMAPSDHDNTFDYNQVIEALGVESQLFSLNGTEVSPTWGHINGIGLPADVSKTAWGALPLTIVDPESGRLRQRTPLDIVRGLKQDAGALLVQLNHARKSSQTIIAYSEYDPGVGFVNDNPEQTFLREIDMIELFNGRDATCVLLRDWYSFLDQGLRVKIVGNADTHGLGGPAGFPRNYIGVANDTAASLTRESLGAAIQAGDITIAGGALITLDAAWKPGQTYAVTANQPITIPVKVESPPWSRTTTLLVVVNGRVQDTITFDPSEADLVDFDGTVEVTAATDAHVHLIAYGTERMSAVYGGAPYSVTNAFFLDTDGDTDNNNDPFEPAGPGQAPASVDYEFCDL